MEIKSVTISGTDGSEAIEITDRDGLKAHEGSEYYQVRFTAGGIHVSQNVYAFDPLDESLPLFFVELSESLGTGFKRHWSSLEGEFEIDCHCDNLGHAVIEATLHSNAYGPGWTVKLRFTMEAGQVDRVAKDLQRFFAVSQ